MENNPEKRIAEITKLFADLTKSGVQLYQIYKLTSKELTILYELAHNLFVEGRYQEAKEMIASLCWLSNKNVIFWKALAATEEKLGDYAAAENACAMTLLLEPDNHQAYLDLAHYATKLEHFNVVDESLQRALALATAQKKGSVIIKEVEALILSNNKHLPKGT